MALRKILVTGAGGMLGKELVPYLTAQDFEVTATTSSHLNLLETADSLRTKLEALEPEVIVHAAAYTRVDDAERNADLAMAVNKDGTRKLALAARDLGAIFVYLSSDFVFDGQKREPYTVGDRPQPLSVYGLSKYYGELMVTENLDTYYIIRTSWLYGLHGRNFVQFVLDSARLGREVPIVTDWTGTPTWTGTLAMMIERVMTSGAYGTYHVADQGPVSRYDQAMAVCEAAGLSGSHLRRITADTLGLAARRPAYSALDCGELSTPHWKTSLQAYLQQYLPTLRT